MTSPPGSSSANGNQSSHARGQRTRELLKKLRPSALPEDKVLTADKFIEVWKYYDRDATRYLEEDEIRRFLTDLANAALAGIGLQRGKNVSMLASGEIDLLYKTFMEEFDEDQNGKISVRELAEILPVEQTFMVLFQSSSRNNGHINYMEIWKRYDKDGSGFIELAELKEFLGDLVIEHKLDTDVNEKKLDEFARNIMIMFNTRNDGKLGLPELIRLLPYQPNYAKVALDQARRMRQIKKSDITNLLKHYDPDDTGSVKGTHLTNLSHDILEACQGDDHYNVKDVESLQKAIMEACDGDGSGSLDRQELVAAILTIANKGLSGVYQEVARRRSIDKPPKVLPTPEKKPESKSFTRPSASGPMFAETILGQ